MFSRNSAMQLELRTAFICFCCCWQTHFDLLSSVYTADHLLRVNLLCSVYSVFLRQQLKVISTKKLSLI
jgi:hypothetical protein